MPRPFPHSFQVGIDICHIPRIISILNGSSSPSMRNPYSLRSLFPQRTYDNVQAPIEFGSTGPHSSTQVSHGEDSENVHNSRLRLLTRIFNHYERKHYMMLGEGIHKWDYAFLEKKDCNFVAGRYAAKEAIIKAMRHRKLNFHDIVILPADIDFPSLQKDNLDRKQHSISMAPRAVVLAERSNISARRGKTNLSKLAENGSQIIEELSAKAAKVGVSFEEYYDNLLRWDNGEEVQLNISHDGDYAIAICMAHSKPEYYNRFSNFRKNNMMGMPFGPTTSEFRLPQFSKLNPFNYDQSDDTSAKIPPEFDSNSPDILREIELSNELSMIRNPFGSKAVFKKVPHSRLKAKQNPDDSQGFLMKSVKPVKDISVQDQVKEIQSHPELDTEDKKSS